MRSVERGVGMLAAFAAWGLAALVAGCGGGSSSVTTLSGGGLTGGTGATQVAVTTPVGPNTTEIVVDAGPSTGFSLGAVNLPYVTVTVCTPGSATACVTIDHVFLDTGSVGLRVLKSKVASLALPPETVPADAASGTASGAAYECYPFVLGAIWGPLVQADVHVASEVAGGLPVQLVDDAAPAAVAAPTACVAAANGGLLSNADLLQANGILGVGMVSLDCGVNCVSGNYASGYTLYYSCQGSGCAPAALPAPLQVQNPVAHFAVDNNGTMIALPALPDLGASTAIGRLVFGIGTQSNNQLPAGVQTFFVDADPSHATYLYLTLTSGGVAYPDSYLDSGSNAFFFDDPTIPQGCQSSGGKTGGWYCPPTVLRRSATLTDARGQTGQFAFSVAGADALFSTASLAFADLAGMAGQGSGTFVLGLPFFYGRTVYTAIWGQALAPNGPWNAF